MPKFLRIGVHQSNVSGYTSKAWLVRRVGSTVFLKWGAVEVHRRPLLAPKPTFEKDVAMSALKGECVAKLSLRQRLNRDSVDQDVIRGSGR